MSWHESDQEDTTAYNVVVNHEEQYSIWPDYKTIPAGWRLGGKSGPKADCLAYIKEVWTDMRPLSLRKRMEAALHESAPIVSVAEPPVERPLVDRLSEGTHPIIVSLRPEKSVRLFKAVLERNYVHIKFTNTRGGTELGVRLDTDLCRFSHEDLEAGRGPVHLEGSLTLDYTKVRCIADVRIETLDGTGHLVKSGGSIS